MNYLELRKKVEKHLITPVPIYADKEYLSWDFIDWMKHDFLYTKRANELHKAYMEYNDRVWPNILYDQPFFDLALNKTVITIEMKDEKQ